MPYLVVTTTWNSADLVGIFLEHYRRLGFAGALVMDFASTDGTPRILSSAEWRGFVEVASFPGISELDSSNVLLATAKERAARDQWCLFCDPDEFLVTPSMSVRDLVPAASAGPVESRLIRRFNVTAPLSIAQHADHRLTPADALTLRIVRRHRRLAQHASGDGPLDPAWIFTDIPGKILLDTSKAIELGRGDHTARTSHDRSETAPDDVYLMHYPFRSLAAFVAKIELARLDYAANPRLPPAHGWQQRRWIRLADAGALRDEYLQQFIPDADVERLLQDGTLMNDPAVSTLHRGRS